MWGSPLPFTVWILICLVGPNGKRQQNSSLSLVHELRSSYDEATTDANHVHWDFGRPNEQTRATHENSQELFILC